MNILIVGLLGLAVYLVFFDKPSKTTPDMILNAKWVEEISGKIPPADFKTNYKACEEFLDANWSLACESLTE